MLVKKDLPDNFAQWNKKYKAPTGAWLWNRLDALSSKISPKGKNILWEKRFSFPDFLIKQIGAFGFQRNSASREYEYPLCFLSANLEKGMRVLEVGAGASGFQFALAEFGVDMTSVDPLINPSKSVDWIFTSKEFQHLNKSFGDRVNFIQDFLQNAKLDDNSYDRVFSISAIEHIPAEEIAPLVKEIARILKPSGLFIATIDLFLDCYPFTDKVSNRFGSNISIFNLIQDSGLTIKQGNPQELYGYPEFKPEIIRQNLDQYLVINNTILTQFIILEKL